MTPKNREGFAKELSELHLTTSKLKTEQRERQLTAKKYENRNNNSDLSSGGLRRNLLQGDCQ